MRSSLHNDFLFPLLLWEGCELRMKGCGVRAHQLLATGGAWEVVGLGTAARVEAATARAAEARVVAGAGAGTAAAACGWSRAKRGLLSLLDASFTLRQVDMQHRPAGAHMPDEHPLEQPRCEQPTARQAGLAALTWAEGARWPGRWAPSGAHPWCPLHQSQRWQSTAGRGHTACLQRGEGAATSAAGQPKGAPPTGRASCMPLGGSRAASIRAS